MEDADLVIGLSEDQVNLISKALKLYKLEYEENKSNVNEILWALGEGDEVTDEDPMNELDSEGCPIRHP